MYNQFDHISKFTLKKNFLMKENSARLLEILC